MVFSWGVFAPQNTMAMSGGIFACYNSGWRFILTFSESKRGGLPNTCSAQDSPPQKNDLAPNVSSAAPEKPWANLYKIAGFVGQNDIDNIS